MKYCVQCTTTKGQSSNVLKQAGSLDIQFVKISEIRFSILSQTNVHNMYLRNSKHNKNDENTFGPTHWDLGENVQEQRDNRQVEADSGPTEPLLQVLRHRDHLTRDIKCYFLNGRSKLTRWHMKSLLPQLWGTPVQTASPAATRWTEPVRMHATWNHLLVT